MLKAFRELMRAKLAACVYRERETLPSHPLNDALLKGPKEEEGANHGRSTARESSPTTWLLPQNKLD